MAHGTAFVACTRGLCFNVNPFPSTKPTSVAAPTMIFSPNAKQLNSILSYRKKPSPLFCVVEDDEKFKPQVVGTSKEEDEPDQEKEIEKQISAERLAEKLDRKRSERFTYLVAAVMSTFGITCMAAASVYYRFSWQMEGGEVPYSEMFGTFAVAVGAAVGMEFWARWVHRELWHNSLMWHIHESHHKPGEGPFELNDALVIVNAVPAIGLLSYGFLHKGLVPGLSFGAGLGLTMFGMAYVFVHDGLMHKRFPVGPIANVPYFRRIAAAHEVHQSEKFNGVPYGLFLGPQELVEVGGLPGLQELEKEIKKITKGS